MKGLKGDRMFGGAEVGKCSKDARGCYILLTTQEHGPLCIHSREGVQGNALVRVHPQAIVYAIEAQANSIVMVDCCRMSGRAERNWLKKH